MAQLTERLEKREAELGEELKAALAKGEEQQQRLGVCVGGRGCEEEEEDGENCAVAAMYSRTCVI